MTALPCRVLIADDTPDIRLLLRWSLEEDDRFEIVGEVSNGAEALAVLLEIEVDAVLLDLAMPVMDGLQAIPRIKTRSPSTRILVLSGFDQESMASEALSRGADVYLEKGVAVSEVATVLAELCKKDREKRV